MITNNDKIWTYKTFKSQIRKIENKLKRYPLDYYFNDAIKEIQEDNKVIIIDFKKFKEIKEKLLKGVM